MHIRKALLILLMVASLQTSAQVIWGIKGGANVSSLGNTSTAEPARLGYHLGTFYSQHIEEQYGWQIGMQYSLQGARDSTNPDRRLSYHYLNLPIIMKFYFAGNTFAELGPQFGYLLSAQAVETGVKSDLTESVKRWDFMGLVGLGHETDSGASMGLRFGWGFLNAGNTQAYKNLLFQAYIGIKLKEFE